MTADLVQDFLVIDHVSKSFGALRAVDDVCLNVARGDVFSLLGPSGCGKTTLLRMLAGFERPESGRILLNGADITELPPEKRPVNTVFQNYALFPHLSVWENIAFGLKIQGRSKQEIQTSVERMLALVRLEDQATKAPAQLSGGQKQRVAIARALVNEPQVLLLDEPLAALDLKLRQHMLAELKALQHEIGTTFIYVTHDQGEALSLSHRIAVMNHGRVEQVAVPEVLYELPTNAFVAGFIGEANFLPGTVREVLAEGRLLVEVADAVSLVVTSGTHAKPGDVVRVMIRPENLLLSAQRPLAGAANSLAVTVDEVIYFGAHERVQLHCGSLTLHVQQGRWEPTQALSKGMCGWVSFDPNAARVVGV